MNINVHIERMVLEGTHFEGMERRFLQMSVEQELARLLREGGLAAPFSSGGIWNLLSGAPIHLSASVDFTGLGQQIAAGLYSGIGSRP